MPTDSDKITGGCLCGEIRYESDVPPYLVGYCHCKMCQKGLGNLFGTVAFFKQAHFRYIKGTLTWYKSSQGAKRGFCSQCGSPVAFQRLATEDNRAIWLGTLDQPGACKPTVEWHTESKIPWVDMGSDLHEATPEGDSTRYDKVMQD